MCNLVNTKQSICTHRVLINYANKYRHKGDRSISRKDEGLDILSYIYALECVQSFEVALMRISDPRSIWITLSPEEILLKLSIGQRKLESIPAPEIPGYNLDIANPLRRYLITWTTLEA